MYHRIYPHHHHSMVCWKTFPWQHLYQQICANQLVEPLHPLKCTPPAMVQQIHDCVLLLGPGRKLQFHLHRHPRLLVRKFSCLGSTQHIRLRLRHPFPLVQLLGANRLIKNCLATLLTPPFSQWSLLDLELIHLYSTSTSQTFGSHLERQRVWQHAVPQLAFSHSFLLDGLLAISALHLSSLSPARKEMLCAYATQRQDTALSLFRVALSNIDSETCHACLAFSGFLWVMKWASSDSSIRLFFADPKQDAQDDAVRLDQLLCGAGEMVKQYYLELLKGPMAPILSYVILSDNIHWRLGT